MHSRTIRSAIARLLGTAISSIAVFSFSFTALALTGAIYTTDSGCTGVNVNIFASKDTVYLDGGPHGNSGSGLPDGSYYVKVTVPNGTLLGSGVGTPVHVTNGNFDQCYQLSSILIKASDSSLGYDDTTNGGGEYKVWISDVSDFSGGNTKTDNFKVKSSNTPEPNSVGSIAGSKWEDLNADGVWQGGVESGLSGWTIQLRSEDGLTVIDTTQTDTDGDYTFGNLNPGTYQVCEVLQATWYSSYPLTTEPNCHTAVVVVGDQNTIGVDFGNYQNATISGMKWEDMNGNGVKDSGDNGIADWTIFLGGEASNSTITAGDGSYSFSVKPGTYTVCENVITGWTQTSPTGTYDCTGSNGYQVTVTSGDVSNNALDFGNFENITISGYKWNDFDSSHNLNGSEPKLPNWNIFIDGNSNGLLDLGETSMLTDANGNYSFADLGPGTYQVCEVMQTGWVPTAPTTLNPNCHTIAANSGTDEIVNFGNHHLMWCSPGFWATAISKNRKAVLAYIPFIGTKYKAVIATPTLAPKKGGTSDPTLSAVLLGPSLYGGPAFNAVADYIATQLGWGGTQLTGENCPLDANGVFHQQ